MHAVRSSQRNGIGLIRGNLQDYARHCTTESTLLHTGFSSTNDRVRPSCKGLQSPQGDGSMRRLHTLHGQAALNPHCFAWTSMKPIVRWPRLSVCLAGYVGYIRTKPK